LLNKNLNLEDALLLNLIANGNSSVNDLCAELKSPKAKVNDSLDNLLKLGVILRRNSTVDLTKKGLLLLSREIVSKKRETDYYTQYSMNDLPFFTYHNKFRKTTVFCPDLYFEFEYSNETSFPIIYEINLKNHSIDFDLLEVVNNLLYESDKYHPIGFWVLNRNEGSVCGYDIGTLREALGINSTFKQMTFVLGFRTFILIARSVGDQINKIILKFYLTRGTLPYIDTLDWIYEKLKFFWLFLGLSQIPSGTEIVLKSPPHLSIAKKPLNFIPSVLGKIYWTNKTTFNWTIPKILIYTAPTIDNKLSNIAPWFSTCNHGLLEEDIENKTKFGFYRYYFIKLPDVNVVSIILHSRG
jgi:hypothetical protein